MPKLSNEQLRLLFWLAQPDTNFEICRQGEMSEPKYNGLDSYVSDEGLRLKFDIRTLSRLQRVDFVTSSMVMHYGIKWEAYYPTETGIHLLASQSKIRACDD